MDILTIGGATQDIFLQYKDTQTMKLSSLQEEKSFILLSEGSKIEVGAITQATGGGATNCAVSFKRLGFNVSIFCKIGEDQAGKFIATSLQEESINTTLMLTSADYNTGTSYIIPSLHGEQTILAFRGANAYISHQEIPYESIKAYKYVYITSLSGDSSQLFFPLATYAKSLGISVITNPGLSQLAAGADGLREALLAIDILILNSSEARQLMVSLLQTNCKLQYYMHQKIEGTRPGPELFYSQMIFETMYFNIVQFFQLMVERGPQIIVVTNGAEGVYVAYNNTIYFHPSLPSNLISTIGAGDAFGSCFVASIIKGNSIEMAMIKGIINSHSVIGYNDAKEGLLTQELLEKHARGIDTSRVQKFKLFF